MSFLIPRPRRMPIKRMFSQSWQASLIKTLKVNRTFPAWIRSALKVNQLRRIFQVVHLISQELQVISHQETAHQLLDKALQTCVQSRLRFYRREAWLTRRRKRRSSSNNSNIHRPKLPKLNNNNKYYSNSHRSSRKTEAVATKTFSVRSWPSWRNLTRVGWNWWSAILIRNSIRDTDKINLDNVPSSIKQPTLCFK